MTAFLMTDPTGARASPPAAGLVLGNNVDAIGTRGLDLKAVRILGVIGEIDALGDAKNQAGVAHLNLQGNHFPYLIIRLYGKRCTGFFRKVYRK